MYLVVKCREVFSLKKKKKNLYVFQIIILHALKTKTQKRGVPVILFL